MVLNYNRSTGYLLKWFQGKEGTHIEMYDMYVKSYEIELLSSSTISIDRYGKHGY